MKKLLLLGMLAASAASQAVLIYDNYNATGGTHVNTASGSLPRDTMADDLSTLAAGSGQTWQVQNMNARAWFAVARQYTDVRMRVRVYRAHSLTGTPEVFSDLASDVTWNLGAVNVTTAGTFFNVGLDYALINQTFNIGGGQNIGVRLDFTEGTVSTDDISTIFSNDALAPAVGTSTDGYYRDADNNGLITSADRRTFAAALDNMSLQMNANAVPEPATMAALGLGAAALIRRRRNVKK